MRAPATRPKPSSSPPAPAARSAALGHGERVLLCGGCGASLEVAIGGGDARCGYCGAVTRFDRRLEEAERPATPAMSESERMERLRSQANPLLAALNRGTSRPVAIDSSGGVEAALARWQACERAVRAGGSFAESERLFQMTLSLAPMLPRRDARTLLEHALESLSDERYRQVLRCMLVEHAVLAGNLTTAGKWLAACDPRPTDLHIDSAFRLAAACVATARGDFKAVQQLLGSRLDEVPVTDERAGEATLLRSNALERSGSFQLARDELLAFGDRHPRNVGALHEAAERLGSLAPCPRAGRAAWTILLPNAEQALRARFMAPQSLIVAALVGAMALVVALVLSYVAVDYWLRDYYWEGPFAIALFAFILGTLLLFFTLPFARQAAADRRFQRVCVLRFARVKAWPREVELCIPSGPGDRRISWLLADDLPPGTYPCLSDPAGSRIVLPTLGGSGLDLSDTP